MAVVIRLQRTGKRKQGYFRVVAVEKTRGPQGRPLEVLGSYNPRGEKPKDKVQIDQDRVAHWVKNGAKPSETVATLISLAKKAEAKA